MVDVTLKDDVCWTMKIHKATRRLEGGKGRAFVQVAAHASRRSSQGGSRGGSNFFPLLQHQPSFSVESRPIPHQEHCFDHRWMKGTIRLCSRSLHHRLLGGPVAVYHVAKSAWIGQGSRESSRSH